MAMPGGHIGEKRALRNPGASGWAGEVSGRTLLHRGTFASMEWNALLSVTTSAGRTSPSADGWQPVL
jgi:hypothetical protein